MEVVGSIPTTPTNSKNFRSAWQAGKAGVEGSIPSPPKSGTVKKSWWFNSIHAQFRRSGKTKILIFPSV